MHCVSCIVFFVLFVVLCVCCTVFDVLCVRCILCLLYCVFVVSCVSRIVCLLYCVFVVLSILPKTRHQTRNAILALTYRDNFFLIRTLADGEGLIWKINYLAPLSCRPLWTKRKITWHGRLRFGRRVTTDIFITAFYRALFNTLTTGNRTL